MDLSQLPLIDSDTLILGGSVLSVVTMGGILAGQTKNQQLQQQQQQVQQQQQPSSSILSTVFTSSKIQSNSKYDVSIPYHAAVELAFQEWTKNNNHHNNNNNNNGFKANYKNKATFDKFQSLYVEKTIAQVTLKKRMREMEQLEQTIQTVHDQLEQLKTST